MIVRLLIVVLVMLPVLLAGCRSKERQALPAADAARSHSDKKVTTIVVPDTVKGKWQAVKIAVIDKTTAIQNIYTIPLNGKISLPSSSLTIEIEAFLPSFIKEGSTITSKSNELRNPGAKVLIAENGTLVFNGWLFARFPGAHAYRHPRYSFTLVDVVPAEA